VSNTEFTPATLTPDLARARHPAVGRGRLYAALQSGALHGVRVGRRTAIDVHALDSWVAQGCPLTKSSEQQAT